MANEKPQVSSDVPSRWPTHGQRVSNALGQHMANFRTLDGVVTGPLAELSELLGFTVLGVRRLGVQIGGNPQPDPNAWRLLVLGADQHARWSEPLLTRRLRDPWWLTRLAIQLGRSPTAPELTTADGRRALRLLHEVIESTTQPKENQS